MLNFLRDLASWVFPHPKFSPPALDYMKLRPDESDDNPLMIQFFTWDSLGEGDQSWWQHLESEIPELARAGITQVWIPPPTKAAVKDGRGYDAYDLWDLGEFDQKGQAGTRWGTKEDLLQACAVAKKYNVDIIVDAVLNHKIGADRTEVFPAVPVQATNRLRTTGEVRDVEGWTAFDFPGRGEKYSPLRWTEEHFSGVDFDVRTHKSEIYRIVGGNHTGWSQHVDRELGNYDYLLGSDINHQHPAVREDFFRWGPWAIETMGAGGFRLDAIKHIDRIFLLDFLLSTKGATNPRLFVVSEYWSPDLRRVLEYVRHLKGQSAFFDVPLHANFHEASKLGSRYDLRTIMNGTLAKARPGDAVTFVDNHDTVEDNFKLQAYALILLRPEGYPCVFYGDLYPNQECYNDRISQGIKLLIEVRKKFAYGSFKEYLVHKNCIGFTRTGDAIHGGCAVVLSNKLGERHDIRMNLGRENGARTFKSLLGQLGNQVDLDDNGWGTFTCVPGSAQVWVPL